MKHKTLSIMLAVLMSMTASVASAYDAKIDGIFYNLTSAGTAEVTSGDIKYTGEVVIPEAVTYNQKTYNVVNIGNYAFKNCTDLTAVSIPGSVTSIGEEAFRRCSALKSVSISEGMTWIGYGVFMYCTSLTSIVIPNSVEGLQGSCFEGCSALISISMGRGVSKIGTLTFSGCSNLKDVYVCASEIPALDNMYSYTTFQNVPLAEATLHVPDYLIEKYKTREPWSKFGKILGLGAEYGFNINGIFYLMVPSAEPLAVSVFDSEEHVGNLDIPEAVTYGGKTYNVTSIGEGAFEGQVGITAITIPSGITSIGDNAFSGCTGVISVTINSNAIASLDAWEGSGNLELSDYFGAQVKHYTFDGGVSKIGDCVGYAFDEVETVTIGKSVTEIGEVVFCECPSLKSVTLGNNVKTIGEEAFCECPSLTSLFIPASVESIGMDAFIGSGFEQIVVESGNPAYDSRNNCNAFIETESNTLLLGSANTIIPDGVESIAWGAFYQCRGLKSVNIPASVEFIDEFVFAYCSGLESIVVEDGNEVYDSRDNCNAIIETESNTLMAGCNKTTVPNSVSTIGKASFSGSGISSLTIPDNVVSIGSLAFEECKDLTSLHIGAGLTSIGKSEDYERGSAFIGCTSLSHIEVSADNTVFDSRNKCNAIIETATNTLILGCKGTIIPNDVVAIAEDAFEGCNITTITIPASVAKIESSAFALCLNLQSIYCLRETPANAESNSFCWDNYENAILYVPNGCRNAYQNADEWGRFYDIREFDVTKLDGVTMAKNDVIRDTYDLTGRKVIKMKRGINIVRMSDGSVKKVMIK